METKTEGQVESLLAIRNDNPYQPGRPGSSATKALLSKIAYSVFVVTGAGRDGFSPEFKRDEVASEILFINAMDREYKKSDSRNETWVRELKNALTEINEPARNDEKNYNVLRVKVAKNPLSRLSFAANSPLFVSEMRDVEPVRFQPAGEQSTPSKNTHQQLIRSELEETHRRLELAEQQRVNIARGVMKKVKAELIKKINHGNSISMEDVQYFIARTDNLSVSEINILMRQLTIIVRVEEELNIEISRLIQENTDPLIEEDIITSEYDIDAVLNSDTVKGLQLTERELQEQRMRLQLRQHQTYHEDLGNSIFIQENR